MTDVSSLNWEKMRLALCYKMFSSTESAFEYHTRLFTTVLNFVMSIYEQKGPHKKAGVLYFLLDSNLPTSKYYRPKKICMVGSCTED